MSLFDELNEVAKQESGGGLIGKGKIETGYKGFAQGFGNRDTFFPCDYHDKSAKEKTLALAKSKLPEGTRISFAIQIQFYKDSVKGRDVTWQDDRFFCYPFFTDAAKKIVLPSLQTAKVEKLGEMWLRVGFAPDPSGRTKKNQNGEDVVDQIAYVAEVYANEQAALAAVAGGDVAAENAKATPAPAPKPTNGKVPDAYKEQPSAWTDFVNSVKAHPDVVGKPKPVIKKYLEKTYKPDEIAATLEELYQAVTA